MLDGGRLTKGSRGHRKRFCSWGSRGYLCRFPSNAVMPTTETYQENQRCFPITKNFPFQPQMQMERMDETEIFHNKKMTFGGNRMRSRFDGLYSVKFDQNNSENSDIANFLWYPIINFTWIPKSPFTI